MKSLKLSPSLPYVNYLVAVPIPTRPNRIMELMADRCLTIYEEGDSGAFEFRKVVGRPLTPIRFRQYSMFDKVAQINDNYGWNVFQVQEMPSLEKLSDPEYISMLPYTLAAGKKNHSGKITRMFAARITSARHKTPPIDMFRYDGAMPYNAVQGWRIQQLLEGEDILSEPILIKKLWYDPKCNWTLDAWLSNGWDLEAVDVNELFVSEPVPGFPR